MDGDWRPVGLAGSAENYLSKYKLKKILGIGFFGKVKVAEHSSTGKKVDINTLNCRKVKMMNMEEKVWQEIKILRLFMHSHVVYLYEVIETPNDIFVVMEYVKSEKLVYVVENGRLGDEAHHFFQQAKWWQILWKLEKLKFSRGYYLHKF